LLNIFFWFQYFLNSLVCIFPCFFKLFLCLNLFVRLFFFKIFIDILLHCSITNIFWFFLCEFSYQFVAVLLAHWLVILFLLCQYNLSFISKINRYAFFLTELLILIINSLKNILIKKNYSITYLFLNRIERNRATSLKLVKNRF